MLKIKYPATYLRGTEKLMHLLYKRYVAVISIVVTENSGNITEKSSFMTEYLYIFYHIKGFEIIYRKSVINIPAYKIFLFSF